MSGDIGYSGTLLPSSASSQASPCCTCEMLAYRISLSNLTEYRIRNQSLLSKCLRILVIHCDFCLLGDHLLVELLAIMFSAFTEIT